MSFSSPSVQLSLGRFLFEEVHSFFGAVRSRILSFSSPNFRSVSTAVLSSIRRSSVLFPFFRCESFSGVFVNKDVFRIA